MQYDAAMHALLAPLMHGETVTLLDCASHHPAITVEDSDRQRSARDSGASESPDVSHSHYTPHVSIGAGGAHKRHVTEMASLEARMALLQTPSLPRIAMAPTRYNYT